MGCRQELVLLVLEAK